MPKAYAGRPFMIFETGGTTGLPKGIIHTHYIRAMYSYLSVTSFRMTPESVFMHTGSIVFNGAFISILPSMFLGATFILHRQFDADAFINTAVVVDPAPLPATPKSRNLLQYTFLAAVAADPAARQAEPDRDLNLDADANGHADPDADDRAVG